MFGNTVLESKPFFCTSFGRASSEIEAGDFFYKKNKSSKKGPSWIRHSRTFTSTGVFNLWENRSRQRSEIEPLLIQMESLTRSCEGLKFLFVNRNCNKLAHKCAHLVSRSTQVEEWLIRTTPTD
jgi:hypothetical protein